MKHRTHILICAVLSSAAGLSVQPAEADVVFEQVETVTTDAFISLDIPKPSGTVEDELLIAIVASEKSNAITSQAGWTLIDDGVDGDKGNSRTIASSDTVGAGPNFNKSGGGILAAVVATAVSGIMNQGEVCVQGRINK